MSCRYHYLSPISSGITLNVIVLSYFHVSHIKFLNNSSIPRGHPLFPTQQAGFRRGQSTVERVTPVSHDIRDYFEDKKKAAFID